MGTYSAPPTDEETLVNFYIRVRPWGWWRPVAAKAVARYPQVTRNRHFKRDMFNVAIGIVWQCCLTIVPMYLVVRGTGGTHCVGVAAGGDHRGVEIYLVQAVVQGREGI